MIFRIASDIVKIKIFRRIPKITIHNTNDYYKASYGCNYALAYSLYVKRFNNNNQAEKQLIITLLININEQIKECIKKQQLIINKEKSQRENKIKEIMDLLSENKVEKSKRLIEIYLTNNKFLEYKYLLNKMLEIIKVKGDKNYSDIEDILNQISFSITFISFNNIISSLRYNINSANIELSMLYLEIVNKYYPLIKNEIKIDEINQAKALLEKYQAEEVFLKEIISSLEKQGINAIKLDNIPDERRVLLLKIAHNIPNILVNEKKTSLFIIRHNKIKEYRGKIEGLIKRNTSEDIVTLINNMLSSNGEQKTITKLDLQEIAFYLKENNISLDDAIVMYELTKDQLLTIKLYIAELYYIEEDYSTGDSYIKEVQKQEKKRLETAKLLNYIKKNRDTYKNTRGFSKRLIRIIKQSNE